MRPAPAEEAVKLPAVLDGRILGAGRRQRLHRQRAKTGRWAAGCGSARPRPARSHPCSLMFEPCGHPPLFKSGVAFETRCACAALSALRRTQQWQARSGPRAAGATRLCRNPQEAMHAARRAGVRPGSRPPQSHQAAATARTTTPHTAPTLACYSSAAGASYASTVPRAGRVRQQCRGQVVCFNKAAARLEQRHAQQRVQHQVLPPQQRRRRRPRRGAAAAAPAL